MRSIRVLATVFAAVAGLAAALASTPPGKPAPQNHAPQPTQQRENLNCNDPAVSKGADAWQADKAQLQTLDQELAKVFRYVADKAGIPKTHYGLLHCGTRERDVRVIVVDGVRRTSGKYFCNDSANFAVAFDPDKKSFGIFHFAANVCRPSAPAKSK